MPAPHSSARVWSGQLSAGSASDLRAGLLRPLYMGVPEAQGRRCLVVGGETLLSRRSRAARLRRPVHVVAHRDPARASPSPPEVSTPRQADIRGRRPSRHLPRDRRRPRTDSTSRSRGRRAGAILDQRCRRPPPLCNFSPPRDRAQRSSGDRHLNRRAPLPSARQAMKRDISEAFGESYARPCCDPQRPVLAKGTLPTLPDRQCIL